jgi:phosphoribosylglycinamide formyltransferase-1
MASGRGSNFDALHRSSLDPVNPAEIVVVVSDQPGAPVLEKARRFTVPVEVIDPGTRRGAWSQAGVGAALDALRRHRVEAICLAGFMRVLPSEIVGAFPNAILNIHPSLLPAFPGLRAQRQALRAGVKVTGCTVHLVDEGVDTGPILVQRTVPVEPGDTEDTLANRILEQEHRAYPEALRALAEGRVTVEGTSVTLAPTLT